MPEIKRRLNVHKTVGHAFKGTRGLRLVPLPGIADVSPALVKRSLKALQDPNWRSPPKRARAAVFPVVSRAVLSWVVQLGYKVAIESIRTAA